MSTRAFDLNQLIDQEKPTLLVDEVTPANSDVSDVFTGFSGAGSLVLRAKASKTSRDGATPNVTITVQHSSDGSSWSTLGTFSAITDDRHHRLGISSAPNDQIRFSYAVTTAARLRIELTEITRGGGSSSVTGLTNPLIADLDANGHNITNVGALTAGGLTGATSQTRTVGANTAGPPTTGTWAQGDVATDYLGFTWVCTVAGSPGTWVCTNGSTLGVGKLNLANVGDYIETGDLSASFFTLTEGREQAMPLYINETMTFDQLGIYMASHGNAGSVVRVGIRNYVPATPATPGSVLLDAGTLDTTIGTTGQIYAKTISQQLTPGIWWLTCTQQGGAGTTTQVCNVAIPMIRVIGTGPSGGFNLAAPYQNSVSGALGSWTTSGYGSANASSGSGRVPTMYLRRSA